MFDVTLLTPSMPERAGLLGELLQSVAAQTLTPVRHIIETDWTVEGFVTVTNRIAKQVRSEWLMILPDDDLIDPQHLMLLASAATADVVYSFCRVTGRDGWTPNTLYDQRTLESVNYIPGGACLIRTALWERLCGYKHYWEHPHNNSEDWDFWLRALEVGAKFKCLPTETWTYRFHGKNMSLGELPANCR